MGLQFLFASALWALPLAGLPLILHLLYRQKARVLPFSTLRFIRSSLRQNATRRKVQRWLLLACRALLILLLIWALAQPARRITSGLLGGGTSVAAAIVVDTSYSMLLQDQQRTLLHEADDDIQDLLRTELRDAHVAIFRSPAAGSPAPRLQEAAAYRGDRWAPLTPTPNPTPLIDRVSAAADLLAQSGDATQWLIVLTDCQQKEFPRPLPQLPNCRTILIDLHPADVRTAAITAVHTDPLQPRLGIPAQIVVDVTGRPNDARDVTLHVAPLLDSGLPTSGTTSPLPMARFNASGRTELRAPFSFTDPSWLLVTAQLSSSEALPWASARSELVRVPPRRPAAVLSIGRPNPMTTRMIRLALDPSEGRQSAWPLIVRDGEPKWDESLIVAVLNEWPDPGMIDRMDQFVRRGNSLVLFVQPGLEESWRTLDAARQTALAALLPSAPQPSPIDAIYHASIPRPSDPILAGAGDTHLAEARLVVTRLIRFVSTDPQVQSIINAVPTDPDSGADLTGLLWRRSLGTGTVFTWATLPDRTCGNLRVWDLFPPTLVNAAAAAETASPASNTEIGRPLVFPAADVPPGAEVDLTPPPPDQKPIRIDKTDDRYILYDTAAPGLYAWRWQSDNGKGGLLGWENVQIPSSEAQLVYRPLNEIATDPATELAGHSLAEVRRRLTQMEEPQPLWTLPIALVLLLLCFEALLGALPRRKPAAAAPASPVYFAGVDSR